MKQIFIKYKDLTFSDNITEKKELSEAILRKIVQPSIIQLDLSMVGIKDLNAYYDELNDFVVIRIDGPIIESDDDNFFESDDDFIIDVLDGGESEPDEPEEPDPEEPEEPDPEEPEDPDEDLENIFIYAEDNDGLVMVSARKEMNLNTILPSSVDGIPVYKIDYKSTQGTKFKTFIIPEGIIEIM